MLEWAAPLQRYVAGKRVLAFLHRTTEGRWLPIGLSYGTLYPGDDGFAAYRTSIREALALQSDPPVSEADKTNWHIRAAAAPSTRWHGLWPLVWDTDMTWQKEGEPLRLLGPQRQALRRIFLATAPSDETLSLFLEALRDDHTREVDAVAIASVGAMDPSQVGYYDRLHTIQTLLKRLHEDDLLSLIQDNKMTMDAAWAEANRRHPPVPTQQTR